jgi:hypothetical protein
MKSVYYAVLTGDLNKAVCASSLNGLIYYIAVASSIAPSSVFHTAQNLKEESWPFWQCAFVSSVYMITTP